MFEFKDFDLSDINTSRDSLNVLYGIFKTTLNPDLTEREFMQYLFGNYPDCFEMSFIYKEDDLAGFCTSAAYPRKLNGKKIIVLRSAFGLLDEYKNGKFPLHGLFYKYMRYKLKHLFTPVYVAGFMANPLMYAMICKYTLTCYPRRNKKVPENMITFKNDLLRSMNLLKKEENPFVLKIHFQVRFKETDIERFEKNDDEDVKYFLKINPNYQLQRGVMVLVPVTIPNMAFTFIWYLFRRTRKFLKRKPVIGNNIKWGVN